MTGVSKQLITIKIGTYSNAKKAPFDPFNTSLPDSLIQNVQHRLGHADVETTLNTYSHTIDTNDIAAANIIAELHA